MVSTTWPASPDVFHAPLMSTGIVGVGSYMTHSCRSYSTVTSVVVSATTAALWLGTTGS